MHNDKVCPPLPLEKPLDDPWERGTMAVFCD
jgi:hypothetical protein